MGNSNRSESGATAWLPTVLTALVVGLATVTPAWAQQVKPLGELQEVGVTEHLDAQVPGDLEFVDSGGKSVKLGQFFDGKRPVLLTINYSNCPMLCSLQLTGLFDALGKMPWDLGDQYQMVTVSMDPLETSERAQLTKQKYLKLYARGGAAEGYHFLTGREEDIRRLTDTVGFRYKFDPKTGQYLHVAVTMVLKPDGRVSRYLYGVQYDPQTVRLSLLEASEGKVGTTTDRVLLYCFHYDPARGTYGLAAFRLMQVGGGLTVVVLGGIILVFRRRGRGKARTEPAEQAEQAEQTAPTEQSEEG